MDDCTKAQTYVPAGRMRESGLPDPWEWHRGVGIRVRHGLACGQVAFRIDVEGESLRTSLSAAAARVLAERLLAAAEQAEELGANPEWRLLA